MNQKNNLIKNKAPQCDAKGKKLASYQDKHIQNYRLNKD